MLRELYLLPDAKRRLFAGINPSVTGPNAIKGKLVELHDKLLGVQIGPDSPEVAAAYRLFCRRGGARAPSGERLVRVVALQYQRGPLFS